MVTKVSGLRIKQDWLKRQYQATLYNFIIAELELSKTFAERALISSDPETRERNSGLAHQGYETASKFLHQERLTDAMRSEIDPRVAALNHLFQQLNTHQSR